MSWQTFTDEADPAASAGRLAQLRAEMDRLELDAMLVPRADAHQGEYVSDRDARLAWLTGFTGSAGFAVVTRDAAALFADARYKVQMRQQIDPEHFAAVDWPDTKPGDWLADRLPVGARLGFDPWLHTRAELRAMSPRLKRAEIGFVPVWANPVDLIRGEIAAPVAPVRLVPDDQAGETSAEKRARLAQGLRKAGQASVVLTLPDAICWLLNIRGSDIARNPLMQGFATLDADGEVTLFTRPGRDGIEQLRDITVLPEDAFSPALSQMSGPVRVDPKTAPEAVFLRLESANIAVSEAPDPATAAKACKTAAELDGMRAAHRADACAMIALLAWLDAAPANSLTEIDVVRRLEELRRAAGATDISFDTISGVGGHGAIVHYRVTEASNRVLAPGEVFLLDSGGQYRAGTTDITRTIPIGPVRQDARRPYTRVLQGMIALSQARFPQGCRGRDIDALARAPLWSEGWDYDHGTGHGVGAALCVHEGPARISRAGDVVLEAGMILSNEPGYYREDAFGIRLENILSITHAEAEAGRNFLQFETLTLVPIDRRLIAPDLLTQVERDWLNAYHARIRAEIIGLEGDAARWLEAATAPL